MGGKAREVDMGAIIRRTDQQDEFARLLEAAETLDVPYVLTKRYLSRKAYLELQGEHEPLLKEESEAIIAIWELTISTEGDIRPQGGPPQTAPTIVPAGSGL